MRFFIDKTSGANYEKGFEYFAAGIIEKDYTKNKEGAPSGKDYAVAFIDPWGTVCREWRSVNDVRVITAEDSAYELLKMAIEKQGSMEECCMKIITITKKESEGWDELFGEFYCCPQCGDPWLMTEFKFCHNCGNKLKWEVKE